MLTAGLTLNTLWAALLLRPVSFYDRKRSTSTVKCDSDPTGALLIEDVTTVNKTNLKDIVMLSSSQPNITTVESDNSNGLRPRTYSCLPKDSAKRAVISPLAREKLSAFKFISTNEICSSFTDISMPHKHINRSESKLAREDQVEFSHEEETNNKCKSYFSGIFRVRIFKNKLYLVYTLAWAVGDITPMYALMFIAAFAEESLHNDNQVATVLSVISLIDFGGRILFGYMADKGWVKKHHLVMISNLFMCILLCMNTFYREFWHFVLFAVLFGVIFGVQYTLFGPMLIEIIGLEDFPNGIIPIMLTQTVICSIVAPFIGRLSF